jgi:XTP/dITP diphosphohydrolase
VRCAAPGHPQGQALAVAGIPVEVLTGAPDRQAAALRAQAARHGGLTWLAADGEGPLRELLENADDLEVRLVHGVPAGTRLLAAVAVMDRLRSPGGCPWDAEQTHESLSRYLLEESYEAVQSVHDGDLGAGLCEELGDILLQVLFHARVAAERPDGFDIDDVAGGLVAKLVRRHPHVFAGADAADAAAVETRWDEIKAAEKGGRSLVDGVPAVQPPLAQAQALLRRAARAGLVVPPAGGEGVGARLLALVQQAQQDGIDAEAELRTEVTRLRETLRAADGV